MVLVFAILIWIYLIYLCAGKDWWEKNLQFRVNLFFLTIKLSRKTYFCEHVKAKTVQAKIYSPTLHHLAPTYSCFGLTPFPNKYTSWISPTTGQYYKTCSSHWILCQNLIQISCYCYYNYYYSELLLLQLLLLIQLSKLVKSLLLSNIHW